MTCDSESSASQQRGTPVKRKLSEQHGQSQIQSSNQNIPSTQKKSQRSEAKRARKMEIETEFRILKSLIPNIANKQQINELEIIDACVNYIEALQDQLNIRSSSSTHSSSSRPQQSVMSAMSAAAAAAAASATCQVGDMSDEVNSVGDDLEADDNYDIEDEENKWSSLASLAKEHEAGTSEEEDISESSSDSESEGEEEIEEENNNAASLSESVKKTEMIELKKLTSDVASAAATLTSSEAAAPSDKVASEDAAPSKTSSIDDSTGNAEKPSS